MIAKPDSVWEPGRLFQVDSFTDEPFKGNPAGVVLCDGSESETWMQDMAFEMNLSETAFPSYGISPLDKNPAFSELVGFEPVEMYRSESFSVAVAGSEDQILNASPRFDRLEKNGLGDLLVTAESLRSDTDFVLRCFCPLHGIDEDPVTGSAHCTLVPLWHGKSGKTEFVSRQLSRRGGTLRTRSKEDRVEIFGKAVTIFEGRCVAREGR